MNNIAKLQIFKSLPTFFRKRSRTSEVKVRIYEDLIPKDLDSRRKLADVVKDARLKGKRTMFVRGDFEGKKYISPNT